MGLGTWFDVVDDVMLQRWHTRHLPTDPAEVLGPDVKGKTFILSLIHISEPTRPY